MLIDVQALFDALAKVLGQREQVDIIIRVEEKELKNEKKWLIKKLKTRMTQNMSQSTMT